MVVLHMHLPNIPVLCSGLCEACCVRGIFLPLRQSMLTYMALSKGIR